MNEINKKFWNERAGLGTSVGTNDTNLKQIELKTVLKYMPTGSLVLDAGCGDGSTLIQLAAQNNCSGIGVDFAENMVERAKCNAICAGVSERVDFVVGATPGLAFAPGTGFDCALTERCLINLGSVEEQRAAVEEILSWIRPRGQYLMLEHSVQGLDRVNELRAEFDLEPIPQPWHNLYLDEQVVRDWDCDFCMNGLAEIESEHWPASTYYLLSRVVYAKMMADAETEPDYDSVINRIAVRLPSFGEFGYSRLWVWRRL